MNRLALFLIFLLPIQAIAGGTEEKARKLFEVQGVVSSYKSLLDQSRAQAKEESKQMIDQVLSQLNPPQEFQNKISLAADKYTKALLTDRTAEDIVEIIVKFYAPKFTEK